MSRTRITPLHRQLAREFRATLEEAGLPQPEEVAYLRRAVVFVWYSTKAVVFVDLDEVPEGEPPFAGIDLEGLGESLEPPLPHGFLGLAPPLPPEIAERLVAPLEDPGAGLFGEEEAMFKKTG